MPWEYSREPLERHEDLRASGTKALGEETLHRQNSFKRGVTWHAGADDEEDDNDDDKWRSWKLMGMLRVKHRTFGLWCPEFDKVKETQEATGAFVKRSVWSLLGCKLLRIYVFDFDHSVL